MRPMSCLRLGGYVAFDLRGVELAFIFEQIELGAAGLRVDDVDLLAFFEKESLKTNVGLDRYRVVIDEKSFADSPFVLVAIDNVLEIRLGVGCRRGGKPDFDGVEMVERISPDGEFAAGVPAVAGGRGKRNTPLQLSPSRGEGNDEPSPNLSPSRGEGQEHLPSPEEKRGAVERGGVVGGDVVDGDHGEVNRWAPGIVKGGAFLGEGGVGQVGV